MSQISRIELPDGNKYGIRAGAIPFGQVASTSTATVFTATIDGITELADGTCVFLENGVVTSATNFTLNINGLGAKPVYTNLAAATRDSTIFNINYTMLFVYDSTRVSGGCWICYRGYDSNTNTIGYQLRTNSSTRAAADKGYRYRLWLSSADNTKWVPINVSTATNATTARTLNTRAINPFGEIIYYNVNGTTNADATLTAANLWEQYTLSIGYSYVLTLTSPGSVYLKCTPQTDGSAVMSTITQSLPTTNDGFIYIYLGRAYSSTDMELVPFHPIYYHDGNGIKIWTGHNFATVATSGSYDDLSNKPTIPTVNDATLTIQKNSTSVGTFTANASSNKSINITVPTKTSELTNDSGFITEGASFGGIEMHGVTLEAANWSSNAQTITITSNAIATSDFLSIPQVDTASEYSGAGVKLVSATVGSGTVTLNFTCTTTPSSDVSTTVLVSTSEMETETAIREMLQKYPKIQNGKWYTWDITNSVWVDSNLAAGITSITQTTTSTADGGTNVVTATLSDGTTSTFNIKNGTKGSIGAKGDTGEDGASAYYYLTNTTIAAASWTSDSTYSNYPYKTTITYNGISSTDGVSVTFSEEDALSGNYAPFANTITNGIELWSRYNTAVTIPTIAILPTAEGTLPTPSTASQIDYSHASSGLSASNVQDAIDEVANSANISYNPITSGLSAMNVQAAIDELGSIRIVETGTDNSWSYRKWSDGTYEAWIRNDSYGTANTNVSEGGWYRAVISLTLPSFVDSDNFDCYVIQATCRNKYTISSAWPEDNTIKVALYSAASGSDSYRLTGYLRGTYS